MLNTSYYLGLYAVLHHCMSTHVPSSLDEPDEWGSPPSPPIMTALTFHMPCSYRVFFLYLSSRLACFALDENVVSRVRQCSQNTTESAVHLHCDCKWKHMNCYTSKAISLKFVGETLFIQMRTSKTPLLMYVHAHKMKYICIVLFSTYSILTGVWSGA